MPKNRGIIGHVEWRNGSPATDLIIELEEKDFIFHDILPWGKTDKDGNFIVSYHPEIYGGSGRLGENPDVELVISYLNQDKEKKTFKKFYEKVQGEWLKVNIQLEDDFGTSTPESKYVPIGVHSQMINLKDHLNTDDIESNEIWEVCTATSTAFSRGRYERIMKLTSWGGRVIVGDIFEGPLTRAEKNLTPKGIKSLNPRKNKPKYQKLNFLWLDENNDIIHEIKIENQNSNYISEKGLNILLRELDETGKKYRFLPVEKLKTTTEIQIQDKKFNFEVFCLQSISKLKGLISTPPFK
ncbi:MAG: hypothetical protein ACTSRG_07755 [Candidatus Helarchaeota archaeon]